jgi:IclR family transcriptional regulator, pca regulon regulatory protein
VEEAAAGARSEDPNFMMSLARGLAVLECFTDHRDFMSVALASTETGLSQSAVRRCLYTLTKLGYAEQLGQFYRLTPKSLTLGYAFLSSDQLVASAQPIMDKLRDETGESCSLGVRVDDQLVYAARSSTKSIMSVSLTVGSRLPLYCTSMGRILLAGLSHENLEAYLRMADLAPVTRHTITSRTDLLTAVAAAREEGYAIVDQELELGLRSIAVPVFGRDRSVVAALNVATQVSRTPAAELRTRILPHLRAASQQLGQIVYRA